MLLRIWKKSPKPPLVTWNRLKNRQTFLPTGSADVKTKEWRQGRTVLPRTGIAPPTGLWFNPKGRDREVAELSSILAMQGSPLFASRRFMIIICYGYHIFVSVGLDQVKCIRAHWGTCWSVNFKCSVFSSHLVTLKKNSQGTRYYFSCKSQFCASGDEVAGHFTWSHPPETTWWLRGKFFRFGFCILNVASSAAT